MIFRQLNKFAKNSLLHVVHKSFSNFWKTLNYNFLNLLMRNISNVAKFSLSTDKAMVHIVTMLAKLKRPFQYV